MKKISILMVLIIGATFIFSGCGKEVVEGTDELRCDGVYVTTSKNSDGKYGYLRFYEEGSVHEMTNREKLDPQDAYEQLNTVSNPNQLNRAVFASDSFKVNSNVIIESEVDGVKKKMKAPDVEFTFSTTLGTNTCYININGDKLKMKMINYQGEEFEYTYQFED